VGGLQSMIPGILARATCPGGETLVYKPVIPNHLSCSQFFLNVHGHWHT
jgi:hypothetical protein